MTIYRVVKKARLVFIALCVSSLPAHAWNDAGHMEVGYLAYKALTPKEQDRAVELIKLNPCFKKAPKNKRTYASWETRVAGLPKEKQDAALFMYAATWPDVIKDSKRFPKNQPNNSNDQGDPSLEFRDKSQHRDWHYKDLPYSGDGTRTMPPKEPNAATQIKRLRAVLSVPSSESTELQKSYALCWLMHLVGDVHQPLHAASRFDKFHTEGDGGGNLVSFKHLTNLHSFWDGSFERKGNPSPTLIEQLSASIEEPDKTKASIIDEDIWLDESFRIAKDIVYTIPVVKSETDLPRPVMRILLTK